MMNEAQVHEVFREIMHIGNKFTFSVKPFRVMRKLTTDELQDLLTSWEFKRFKRYCPNLAQGVESFFDSRISASLRRDQE